MPRGGILEPGFTSNMANIDFKYASFIHSFHDKILFKGTVSKRVLISRAWSLIKTFLAFWVFIGSLFIRQGPYFHYFGFIHTKNVNSVCMYTYLQASVPVYTVGKF